MPEEKCAREWTRRLRARLLSGLYVNLNRDYRNSIFLIESGCSGTTWASEIVNKNEYRYVFEPSHPDKINI